MSRLDGLWQLKGDFTVGTDAVGGSGSLTLNGNGAQVITADATAYTGDLIINKASGAVTMNAGSNTLRVRAFYLDQGTFTSPSTLLECYAYIGANNSTVFRITTGTTFNLNSGTVKISTNTNWATNNVYHLDVPDFFQFNNLILHQ